MTLRRALPALFVLWASAAPAWAQQTAAPPDFDALLAQAMRLHQAGDLMGAIDAYQAALRLDPNRGDARSNLGAAYVRLGRFQEAIDQYKKALQSAPADLAIQFNLGLAYYKIVELDQAVPLFEHVIAGSPDNLGAVLLLADSLLQLGEDARVIELLEPRAERFPSDLAFGYLLGTALVRTGQRDRGQVYMDRIFKAGDSAEARLLMGTALLQTKDYPGAVVEFKRAVELNPQLATARTMYGRELMSVGDTDAA
jgi:Flp pilus assembly protein TadD